MKKEVLFINEMRNTFNKRLRDEGAVCYGASKRGDMAKGYFDANNLKIRCFCDSDPKKWGGKHLGYDIISPDELSAMGGDTIIYISSFFAEEIYSSLKERGFKYIIVPQNATVFFDRRYDCYVTGTGSLSARFYEAFSHQLNIMGFLVKGEAGESFCGKPVISASNFQNDEAMIFECDFWGSPFNFAKSDNIYNGAKILFLTENYRQYRHYFDAIYLKENKNSEIALMLEALSNALSLHKPKYADIGANDPIVNNNTYVLYEKGARGQLFEPLPAMCERIRAERPEDTVVNAGIGAENVKNAVFYMSTSHPGISSFSAVCKKAWEDRNNAQYEEIHADLLAFNDVIAPETEIVSIDCEGLDFDIIRTIDFDKFSNLKILCAETPFAETADYMDKKGFATFSLDCNDAIFVKREYFDMIMADRLCREMYYCLRQQNAYYNIPANFLRKDFYLSSGLV